MGIATQSLGERGGEGKKEFKEKSEG